MTKRNNYVTYTPLLTTMFLIPCLFLIPDSYQFTHSFTLQNTNTFITSFFPPKRSRIDDTRQLSRRNGSIIYKRTLHHVQHNNNDNTNANNNSNNNKSSTSFNDAFLNSLENIGNTGGNPGGNTKIHYTNNRNIDDNHTSPAIDSQQPSLTSTSTSTSQSTDSLASLRDLATMNVANFLATFSEQYELDNNSDIDMTTLKKNKKHKNNNNHEDKDKIGNLSKTNNFNNMNNSNDNNNMISSTTTDTNHSSIKKQKKTINIHWDVYICQSKQCIDRGASATLDSFQALVPSIPITTKTKTFTSRRNNTNDKNNQEDDDEEEDDTGEDLDDDYTNTITTITIHPAILSKSKSKGPNIRCIKHCSSNINNNNKINSHKDNHHNQAFEVNNVNDIDKVYHILTKYMNIENISIKTKNCLKYTYQGNLHLQKNELSDAIQAYNMALEQLDVIGTSSATTTKTTTTTSATSSDSSDIGTQQQQLEQEKDVDQEGMILLLRATAYLKRAFEHQEILRQIVSDLGLTVSDPHVLGKLYSIAEENPSLAKSIFQKVITDAKVQDKKFRLMKYRHGLYEYSLLHAAQDSLRSTQLLPHHAKTWLRAGDALAELRKLKESALYYEKAMELDPTLRSRLEPVIERLNRSQEFLDKAKMWWSSDTLRLALDVAN